MIFNSQNSDNLKVAIGQMFLIGFKGTSIDGHHAIARDIHKHHLGGVILFNRDLKKEGKTKNIEGFEQVQELNKTLQSFASLSLPLWISVDYEGGCVNRLSAESFPKTISPQAFAQLSDSDALFEARKMADTLLKLHFNLSFAPLVDVNVNTNNPIIGALQRSFSSDPEIVSHYALIVARALRELNIAFCLKHFPGHGSSDADSHLGVVDVTKTWQNYELIPYERFINNELGSDFIMSAHVIHQELDKKALPASLSYDMLTGLLREKMGYKGLIICDDLQMEAVSKTFGFEKSVELAIQAGNDVLIVGNQLGDYEYGAEECIETVLKGVMDKKISKENIEKAFHNIQCFKSKHTHTPLKLK